MKTPGPSRTLQVCHLVIILPMFYNLAILHPHDSFNMLGTVPPQGLHMLFPLLGMLFPEIFASFSLHSLRSELKNLHLREAFLTASCGMVFPACPDSLSPVTQFVVLLAAVRICHCNINSRAPCLLWSTSIFVHDNSRRTFSPYSWHRPPCAPLRV